MFKLNMTDNTVVTGIRLMTEVADEDADIQINIYRFNAPLWKQPAE